MSHATCLAGEHLHAACPPHQAGVHILWHFQHDLYLQDEFAQEVVEGSISSGLLLILLMALVGLTYIGDSNPHDISTLLFAENEPQLLYSHLGPRLAGA